MLLYRHNLPLARAHIFKACIDHRAGPGWGDVEFPERVEKRFTEYSKFRDAPWGVKPFFYEY
jgi:hypothetical protein